MKKPNNYWWFLRSRPASNKDCIFLMCWFRFFSVLPEVASPIVVCKQQEALDRPTMQFLSKKGGGHLKPATNPLTSPSFAPLRIMILSSFSAAEKVSFSWNVALARSKHESTFRRGEERPNRNYNIEISADSKSWFLFKNVQRQSDKPTPSMTWTIGHNHPLYLQLSSPGPSRRRRWWRRSRRSPQWSAGRRAAWAEALYKGSLRKEWLYF